MTQSLYCCGCKQDVTPRLTSGAEIYPSRMDLAKLPFWKCDACGNYVGCHHKTANPTQPLGSIPTQGIREARKQVHALLDPIWKSGQLNRAEIYTYLSDQLGYQFHTAEIRSLDEAIRVMEILKEFPK